MTSTTLRLSSSGLRVAYRAEGAGAPVVLLHGVGMQSAAWAPQIAELGQTHHVIAVDLPGHGGSDPLPADSRLPDFVSWCRDVLHALDLGPVSLAGHSMGALIAGGVAVSHPELLCRVALLNGVYLRDAQASAAVIARADELHTGKVDLEAPLARWFGNSEADKQARTMVAGWLNTVNLQGYATAYAAFAHGDATYAARLREVTGPFLAMTSDGDKNSTPLMARLMSEQAQDGTHAVIAGHRHMVNLTAPDQVNALLLDWLGHPAVAEAAE